MVWPFGKEDWCNMKGRYFHMVADMSQYESIAADSDIVSVCSVGVYGTKYVRNGDPVITSIEIVLNQIQTISIERIQPSITIANQQDIKLRQISNLDFITITENASSSDVLIDTTGQSIGEYTLILESFDSLSVAQSALKTDTIAIKIS